MLPTSLELIQRILYLYRFAEKITQATRWLKKKVKLIAECNSSSEYCPEESCSGTWGICSRHQNVKTSQINSLPGHYPVQLTQLQCLQQCNRICNQALQCRHPLLGSQVVTSIELSLTALTPGSPSAARRRWWSRWWRSARGTRGSGSRWSTTSPPPRPSSSQSRHLQHSFISLECFCSSMELTLLARFSFIHLKIWSIPMHFSWT